MHPHIKLSIISIHKKDKARGNKMTKIKTQTDTIVVSGKKFKSDTFGFGVNKNIVKNKAKYFRDMGWKYRIKQLKNGKYKIFVNKKR